MTANINDYPQPFFEPIERYYIERSKKLIKVCLLKPDYKSISSAFNKRG